MARDRATKVLVGPVWNRLFAIADELIDRGVLAGDPFQRAWDELWGDERPSASPESNDGWFFLPWYLHRFRPYGDGGAPLATICVKARPQAFSAVERELIETSNARPFTACEVVRVDRGGIAHLRDLWLGDAVTASDAPFPRPLARGDLVLALVLPWRDRPTVLGLHPWMLPSRLREESLASIRRAAGLSLVPSAEELAAAQVAILRAWQRVLQEYWDEPPLRDRPWREEERGEGHVDTWMLRPGARDEVLHRLLELEDMEPIDGGRESGQAELAWIERVEPPRLGKLDVRLGRLRVSTRRLTAMTLSAERHARCSTIIEQACGELVQRSDADCEVIRVVHRDPATPAAEEATGG